MPVQAPPALVDIAMRGGINKIQFQEQQFDSFLGINFTATTHPTIVTLKYFSIRICNG